MKVETQIKLDRFKRNARKRKCDNCENKVLLAFYWDPGYWAEKCDYIGGLCSEHAPKLSNGEPGYKKFTIQRSWARKPGPQFIDHREFKLTESCYTECRLCGVSIENIKDFNLQGIKNALRDSQEVGPCVPVVEVEYYTCKDYDSCNERIDESRNTDKT